MFYQWKISLQQWQLQNTITAQRTKFWSPVLTDVSTTHLLHPHLRDHSERGQSKIVRARGTGNSFPVFFSCGWVTNHLNIYWYKESLTFIIPQNSEDYGFFLSLGFIHLALVFWLLKHMVQDRLTHISHAMWTVSINPWCHRYQRRKSVQNVRRNWKQSLQPIYFKELS